MIGVSREAPERHKVSMLEKVARAIAHKEGHVLGEAADFAEYHWEEFTDHARAAILAMREPTEAMIESGGEAVDARYRDKLHADLEPAHVCYRAMIDAALGVT